MKQTFMNFKMNFYVQFVILLALCILNVDGNTSLKRRVRSLEHRVNSMEIRVNTDSDLTNERFDYLELNVEALNISVNHVQNAVCSIKTKGETNQDDNESQTQSVKNVESVAIAKMLLSYGFADEKIWIRDKLQEFEKETDDSISFFRRELERQNEVMNTKQNVLRAEFKDALTVHKLYTNTKLNESDTRIDNSEQEIGKNLSLINEDILAIKTDSVDTLKSEISKNLEIINEQKLEIDGLKNSLETVKNMIAEIDSRLVSCPTGWTQFQLFCYLYVKDTKKYYSARETCSSLGASVADIQSWSENYFIYRLSEESGHVWNGESHLWIGFTDEATEGVWISDRTTSKATYTNLRPGQPDGGGVQNFMMMGYEEPFSLWNDWTDGNFPFVCKKASSVN